MIEILPTLERWPSVPLGELCDIRGGFPAPQDDAAFEGGEIPFVRMKDVGRHHFTKNLCETEESLNRAHFEGGRYKLTPRGSILMPRSGSVALNHRAILTIDAVVVSHLCALVPTSEKITIEFLYRFLCLADMRKLTKKTTGLDSIAFSDLRLVAIPLPPLAEQRRIVEVLDRAEALRTKRRATLAQLDSLTHSLFLDLFGDPATNGKGFPTTTLASLVRDDDTINYGVVQPGDDRDEGVPLIRVGDLIDGKVRHSDLKRIAPSIEAAYKRSRLRGHEVLLVCVGATAGLVAIADESVKGFNIARAIARIPLADGSDPIFVAAYLRTDRAQRHFQNELRTVAQPTLNIKQICELPVVHPPLERQREFARRVRAVEKLKATQRASLAELDALFASLQHRAFRGEL